MSRIYLDHNASTFLLPQVKESILDSMTCFGNASSPHGYGRKVRQFIDKSRKSISSFFGVQTAQVIFTSGATEANNLVIKGFPGSVIVSGIEHESILNAQERPLICPVENSGLIDCEALDLLLKKQDAPCLVSVMAANNETGVLQPLEEIVPLCRRYGAFIHTDAVQAIGKISIKWEKLGVDYLSLSAHKIGGPQGVGALITPLNSPLKPLITGGGQERFLRSGTENLIGIVGFGTAVEACDSQDWGFALELRDFLEGTLSHAFPEITIFGKTSPRLPNTINLTMPGVLNTVQMIHFDLHDIAISTGSACSSGKVKSSHVLKAMGVSQKEIESSIRVSLSRETTLSDVQQFIKVWTDLYHRKHTRYRDSFRRENETIV